jgi:hypothetical protein
MTHYSHWSLVIDIFPSLDIEGIQNSRGSFRNSIKSNKRSTHIRTSDFLPFFAYQMQNASNESSELVEIRKILLPFQHLVFLCKLKVRCISYSSRSLL